MNPFMKQKLGNQGEINTPFFIDYSKASPEAIDQILSALNAEVDAALAHNRIPTLEGALNRLVQSPSIMM